MANKENYLYGPKVQLPKNAKSIGEFFVTRLDVNGTKVAQILEHDKKVDSLKYSEILQKGKVAAGMFKKKYGLKPRDTVMAVTGNNLEYAPILWGTLFNAAAIAPVNPLHDLSDMIHLMTIIAPQIIVSNVATGSLVKQAMSKYGKPVLLLTTAELEKYIAEHPDVSDFALGKVEDPDTHVCSVLCTTGMSGKPKCVEVSHSTYIRLLDLDYFKSPSRSSDQQVSVNIAGPFGMLGSLLNFISFNMGYKCLLVSQDFDAVALLKALGKHKVNFVSLAPSHLVAMGKSAVGASYDLSSLRQVLIHGSPVSPIMFELAKKNLNIAITPVYSITEAPGICNPAYNKTDKMGTVGVLAKSVSAKIVDLETGLAVGRRKEGGIYIKVPNSMLGYRSNPWASNAALDDEGFFHTGDIGFFDEFGYLFVLDSIIDAIKYQKGYVPASHIEEVLLRDPKVREAAVIAVYDKVDMERAMAFVVAQPGETVYKEELVKLVQDTLPELKWLHGGVRIVDSIAKSINGKFNKRLLREKYGGFPKDYFKPSRTGASKTGASKTGASKTFRS